MKESEFQRILIRKLNINFPNCIILKNDPNYIQGFPDLLILFNDRWAALEVKEDRNSFRQPNQEYYVNLVNGMSYGNFVYPENLNEVISDLQQTFGVSRTTRFPGRK